MTGDGYGIHIYSLCVCPILIYVINLITVIWQMIEIDNNKDLHVRWNVFLCVCVWMCVWVLSKSFRMYVNLDECLWLFYFLHSIWFFMARREFSNFFYFFFRCAFN